MEWDLFEDKMNNQEHEELEKILNKNNNELIVKYQLGIVYSCQYEKKQKAIDIFKELIEMNFHKQYIYILDCLFHLFLVYNDIQICFLLLPSLFQGHFQHTQGQLFHRFRCL